MKRPNRPTAATENGSVPEVKRRRQSKSFFIEQLLAVEPIEGTAARDNGNEQPIRTTTTRRIRRGAKISAPKDRQESDSPPLDTSNWLASKQPDTLRSLHCELDNWETWEQFHQLGTEMIITKSGSCARRICLPWHQFMSPHIFSLCRPFDFQISIQNANAPHFAVLCQCSNQRNCQNAEALTPLFAFQIRSPRSAKTKHKILVLPAMGEGQKKKPWAKRRMFPVLKLQLSGTEPGMLYFPYLDLVPVEGEHRFRYAYNKSQWQSAGKADKPQFGRLFLHPDAPFSGEQLAQPGQTICFDKAKLTNNGNRAGPDQLLLNSMHKYRPRVHILCFAKGHPMAADPPKEFRTLADLSRLASLDYKTFSFQRTTFVAVTAYQNQLVTQKKIELNPFAKGFRDQKAEGIDERANLLLSPPKASSLFRPPNKVSPLAEEQQQPMVAPLPAPWPCWPWHPLQMLLMANAQQQRRDAFEFEYGNEEQQQERSSEDGGDGQIDEMRRF